MQAINDQNDKVVSIETFRNDKDRKRQEECLSKLNDLATTLLELEQEFCEILEDEKTSETWHIFYSRKLEETRQEQFLVGCALVYASDFENFRNRDFDKVLDGLQQRYDFLISELET